MSDMMLEALLDREILSAQGRDAAEIELENRLQAKIRELFTEPPALAPKNVIEFAPGSRK